MNIAENLVTWIDVKQQSYQSFSWSSIYSKWP